MNLSTATAEVDAFFRGFGVNAGPELHRRSKGKVYELYCLAKTVEFLKTFKGVSVRFVGTSIDFKSSPGKIDRNKSHFVISGHGPDLELHTDIEVKTLSSTHVVRVTGPSGYHEIDLVLVEHAEDGQRPAHDQIVLGVECKSDANFKKETLRHVLGVRRELSLFSIASSKLQAFLRRQYHEIYADPPSEYWLAFTDPKGVRYRSAPAVFGIQFKHWCPP